MTENALDFGLEFKSSAERAEDEAAHRAALVKREFPFQVSFLDHALGGILPNDLIVLGARTGAGKTALASMIAQFNAVEGKRVHYFALEAEDKEIERRIKYRLLTLYLAAAEAESYGNGWDNRVAALSYRNWYRGRLNGLLGKYEARAAEALRKSYRTLNTYYRGDSFDLDELDRTFRAYRDETDLFILDHLHYVDSDDPNENRAVKEITKRIRDISLSSGVPVLVIAHLRKKDRGRGPQRLVPDIDDFHGSSDITKIATKCILIAPAQIEGAPSFKWGTYMQVVKDRMDGSLPRYVALIGFDVRYGIYDTDYQLGTLADFGTDWKPIAEDELPYWARYPEVRKPPAPKPANDTGTGDADDSGFSNEGPDA